MSVTEDELKERALAPRVALEHINALVVSEHFFTAGTACSELVSKKESQILGCLTFCVLVLKNGFTVTGQSACADPANYKKDIGERIAKQDAINKVWPLLGYELRSKLALLEEATKPSIEDMKTYIGTKVVHATPMRQGTYAIVRGWSLLDQQDPYRDGFLVEYADGGTPNLEGYTGYVSWSPKEVFEKAYKVV